MKNGLISAVALTLAAAFFGHVDKAHAQAFCGQGILCSGNMVVLNQSTTNVPQPAFVAPSNNSLTGAASAGTEILSMTCQGAQTPAAPYAMLYIRHSSTNFPLAEFDLATSSGNTVLGNSAANFLGTTFTFNGFPLFVGLPNDPQTGAPVLFLAPGDSLLIGNLTTPVGSGDAMNCYTMARVF